MSPLFLPTDPTMLRGFVGPKAYRCTQCGGTNIRTECSYCHCNDSTFDHRCNEGCRDCGGAFEEVVDVRVPAVRDHLARVCAEGVPCPGCPDCAPVLAPEESDVVRSLLEGGACADCGGRVRTVEEARRHESGEACEEETEAHPDRALTVVYTCGRSRFLRPPTSLEGWMDRPGSSFTAEQSAVLVLWSYQRWIKGDPGIRAILGPWRSISFGEERTAVVGNKDRWKMELWGHGWHLFGEASAAFWGGAVHGLGLGETGRAQAEAAALARGVALIEPDGTVRVGSVDPQVLEDASHG